MEEEAAEAGYMKGVRHLSESGVKRVPSKYILLASDRPLSEPNLMQLPIVDLSDRQRSLPSLADACLQFGVFQVVNHGLPDELLNSMIEVSKSFFQLPLEERETLMSADILAPVRYGTSFNQTKDSVFCWRDFLKLTCHPLPDMLPLWPLSPSNFREVAAAYAREMRSLFVALMGDVMETLVVEDEKMREELKEGSQLIALNFFPPCPEPELTLGMPPHSDYGFLTIILQDGVRGLQVHHQGRWVTVNSARGSILVILGDHLEIFSNGKYKSAQHRVFVNSSVSRLSIASLHSLPSSGVVSPSPQLISRGETPRYVDTNFSDFLVYLSSQGVQGKSFLESRRRTH